MDRDKLLDKLYRLEKQKAGVVADKKNAAASYRDQLKDIESEIKEVMAELDEPAPSVDTTPVDFEE